MGRAVEISGGVLGLLLGRFRLAVSSGLLQRPAKEELDLAIEAAQIVIRPALEGLQQGRIDAKQERFAIGHGSY